MNFIEQKDMVAEHIKLSYATNTRKIIFWEEVTEDSCLRLQYSIDKIVNDDFEDGISPQDADPITIAISSYGGSLLDIFSVISYIEELKEKGYKIITIADGKAMSAGAFLLICGSERYARRYASIMLHQLSSGCRGTISEMENEVRECRRLWDLLKELTVKNTQMSPEQIDNIFNTNQDYYYSAQDCVELGIVDHIL
jgi:ATP-dependent Clp endopeptidase proteolytic subunit ClpP